MREFIKKIISFVKFIVSLIFSLFLILIIICLIYGDNINYTSNILDYESSPYITNEELMKGPKENKFVFTFNGTRWEINYTLYEGLNDYLKGLSRTIKVHQGENVTDKDFIMRDLNNEYQNEFLKPFVNYIENLSLSRDDKARIVISLVQNIPYDYKGLEEGNITGKYPYEVMYTMSGVCSEKSKLLVYLLRELGYGTAIFRFGPENHDAVGIKCPLEYSYKNTGYCFVESTAPTIITDSQREYRNVGKLYSDPEVIVISDGYSFESVNIEYNDMIKYIELEKFLEENENYKNVEKYELWLDLRRKYGLEKTECKNDTILCNGECWNKCEKGTFKCTKTGGICELNT